ncbi:MAG: hypothetical protein OXD30_03295, partial [Bryobacterales bacterium]|nr:hypothetical protein [Bryobacterales bacterium]
MAELMHAVSGCIFAAQSALLRHHNPHHPIKNQRCGAARATRDVDVLTIDRRDEVLAAAGEVAREQGLSPDWLNDAVRTAPWPIPRPDARAAVVHDSPHLVVTGASAEQLLAMKVRAGRVGDRADIELLIRRLGISTLQHVESIHHAVFPHDSIPESHAEMILDCPPRVRDALLGVIKLDSSRPLSPARAR